MPSARVGDPSSYTAAGQAATWLTFVMGRPAFAPTSAWLTSPPLPTSAGQQRMLAQLASPKRNLLLFVTIAVGAPYLPAI